MVMKAAVDGSFLYFFKMKELWFETPMLFAKAFVSLFIHFQCGQIIGMGMVFFNSVNTRIQFVLNLLLNSVFILELSSQSLTVLVLSSL